MAEYLLKTNVGSSFELAEEDLIGLDIIKNPDGSFHFLYNNKPYKIKVLKFNLNAKNIVLQVDGREFEVEIKDNLDKKLEEMGLSRKNKSGSNEIKSPMPGSVISLDLVSGQTVLKGDILLILEAMKMENLIKADRDMKIKNIHINIGDSVAKNQLLLEVE